MWDWGFLLNRRRLVTWYHQAYTLCCLIPAVLETGHKITTVAWGQGGEFGQVLLLGTHLFCNNHTEACEKEGHGWIEEITTGRDHTLKHLFLECFLAFCCSSHLLALSFTVMPKKHLGVKSGVRYMQKVMLVRGPHVNTTNIIFAELGWRVFQPACSLWRPLPAGKNLMADVVLAWTMSSFGLYLTYSSQNTS